MKLALMFHDIGCCLTDCLVRQCTCEVEPVFEEVQGAPREVLLNAASREGRTLADGRYVWVFLGLEHSDDGGFAAQYLTYSRANDEAAEEDEP